MRSNGYDNLEEMSDESIQNSLEWLNDKIQEWEDDGVFSGDMGFQDMLQERDALLEEQERRANASFTEED